MKCIATQFRKIINIAKSISDIDDRLNSINDMISITK